MAIVVLILEIEPSALLHYGLVVQQKHLYHNLETIVAYQNCHWHPIGCFPIFTNHLTYLGVSPPSHVRSKQQSGNSTKAQIVALTRDSTHEA